MKSQNSFQFKKNIVLLNKCATEKDENKIELIEDQKAVGKNLT